ncbi:putative bifunctional diguanylate cyclase/phosphodiesterase [Legionella impletisoli]|uniref:Uncharacterized protein n=1 Tax=Legionella impletisoli TaxID=343510 RepID=A0A917K1U6_9GAMM|nr:bifunctional diguanylate cyclase/phosphodiesterase [Legionella impletisoli]GGI93235.1 hypothetical protein GCM10007966_22250 [Legionella impletisoli]
MNPTKILFDAFIPENLRKDIIQYNNAKTLVGVGITASIAVPFFSLFYYFISFPLLSVVVNLIALAVFVSLIIMRYTGSLMLARESITFFLTVLFTIVSFLLGGIVSPSTYWLILPPIINLITGGIYSCFAWSIVSGLIILGLYNFSELIVSVAFLQSTYFFPRLFISIVGMLFVLIVLIYISEKEKKRSLKLRYRAYHDGLTGALNRYSFSDKVENILKEKDEKPFFLLHIDIDSFNSINETLGYEVGDFILIQLHSRLTKFFSNHSLIARSGNDEFSVFYSQEFDLNELLRQIRKPYVFDDQGIILITCSFGRATFPYDANLFSKLVRYANLALEKSKELGGNHIEVFDKELAENEDYHLTIQHQLPTALKKEEFYLYYQPQFSTELDFPMSGLEVLLRWKNPKLGIVPPSEFIPIAEKLGLITEISDWILITALNQFKHWEDQKILPHHFKIAINFSVMQMYRIDALEKITNALKKANLSPHRLEIEITESLIMSNRNMVVSLLNHLRNIGISIAMDDFGTGYSNFNYLTKIPLTSLKIDKSFIDSIPHNGLIVSAIIKMAHSLHLDVIAEGVETQEQLNSLIQNGCDFIQGYYLGKPSSTEEIEQLLIQHYLQKGPKK